MSGEVVGMLIFSGGMIYLAVKILGWIFKKAIQAFNFLGSLLAAIIPAALAVFASSLFWDISVAQAAVQFTATNVVLGGIGMQMFKGVEDNI